MENKYGPPSKLSFIDEESLYNQINNYTQNREVLELTVDQIKEYFGYTFELTYIKNEIFETIYCTNAFHKNIEYRLIKFDTETKILKFQKETR